MVIFTLSICALVTLVPNVRLGLIIGTGISLRGLQEQIESIQSRAIKGKITEHDREFLIRLYRTMAYGAQLTFILPESARLMHHYLDSSGTTISIDKSLYMESKRVIHRMKVIKSYLNATCKVGATRTSSRFDMGHGYPLDAHFALYFGTITGTILEKGGDKVIKWEVKMPWKWPTFDDIKATYGTYFKEVFPFPNVLSLSGLGKPLWLPNALGGELEKQGLARSFEVNTTWTEPAECG